MKIKHYDYDCRIERVFEEDELNPLVYEILDRTIKEYEEHNGYFDIETIIHDCADDILTENASWAMLKKYCKSFQANYPYAFKCFVKDLRKALFEVER